MLRTTAFSVISEPSRCSGGWGGCGGLQFGGVLFLNLPGRAWIDGERDPFHEAFGFVSFSEKPGEGGGAGLPEVVQLELGGGRLFGHLDGQR